MRLGKFPTFFLLMALAALAAAVFGALHNQLSYSVGPDYFLSLKFPQFGIAEGTAPRVGAAQVGVLASWWMGAAVALPAMLYGLFAVPTARSYLAAGIGAIGLVVVLATFAALAGLVGGLVADATGVLDDVVQPPAGVDRSDFLRAGFMHDASYAAGALGALLAFWPMRRAKAIDSAQAAQRAG
ncbi:hypothetical protein [Roseicyclus persicicus]|uniref:DUF1772 domain-containing protein n=1 Tax=Roseicyclus persicicus TaxID=2650661 RepID=A0A7X6GVV3_9RHOB|nr:hypothetical protein [Roseibacterium persicicum]NKX43329.1 hypothetical protein [Roseibacterium persicicum]